MGGGSRVVSAPRPFFLLLAAVFAGMVLAAVLWPHELRPAWSVQRQEQRRAVRDRVTAAGGWDVLRRECVAAFGDKTTDYLRWIPRVHSESNVPPSIVQLRPQDVRVYAAPGEPTIVRIKLFGAHSTGARGIPYYGLWVVCGPTPAGYVPKLDFVGVTVTGKIEKVAESVFEVY